MEVPRQHLLPLTARSERSCSVPGCTGALPLAPIHIFEAKNSVRLTQRRVQPQCLSRLADGGGAGVGQKVRLPECKADLRVAWPPTHEFGPSSDFTKAFQEVTGLGPTCCQLEPAKSLGLLECPSFERRGSLTQAVLGQRGRIQRRVGRDGQLEELLVDVEDEWREVLGEERFAQLKEILQQVWESPLVRW